MKRETNTYICKIVRWKINCNKNEIKPKGYEKKGDRNKTAKMEHKKSTPDKERSKRTASRWESGREKRNVKAQRNRIKFELMRLQNIVQSSGTGTTLWKYNEIFHCVSEHTSVNSNRMALNDWQHCRPIIIWQRTLKCNLKLFFGPSNISLSINQKGIRERKREKKTHTNTQQRQTI